MVSIRAHILLDFEQMFLFEEECISKASKKYCSTVMPEQLCDYLLMRKCFLDTSPPNSHKGGVLVFFFLSTLVLAYINLITFSFL